MDETTNNTKNKDDYSSSSHHTTTFYFSRIHSLPSFQNPSKRSLFASFLCFPTSVFALIIILLLAYNSFSIFSTSVPIITIENGKGTLKQLPTFTTSQLSLNPFLEVPPSLLTKTHFDSVRNSCYFSHIKRLNNLKPKRAPKTPRIEASLKHFSRQVRQFFSKNSCELRVFMTWISSPLESFGEREKFTIESLFKFHPNACLLIISESMDSPRGAQILRPFTIFDFRVMAVSPDYKFVFKNTMAAAWFYQLKKGNIKPGEVSLGQNISNLLRLALLYKYGGIYMDTDFIILKSLSKLKNSIGAQNIDQKTKNWSRLNNALLVFDKKHPLLNKFIEEFALTFNGNKWGHNGPYLVSRVIERLNGSKGSNGEFTVLPPTAFYPVDWCKIRGLFQRPRDEIHLKWVKSKLKQIEGETYALHLWSRQSRRIMVEDGSIISHLMKGTCVLCNFSIATL